MNLLREEGFALLELAMVLVIIGIIMGMAIFSWMSFIEAKKISETSSVLAAIKNCLMEKMVYSLKYPDYSYPLTSTMCTQGSYGDKAVDSCICGRYKDAWGRYIRYLDGFDAANSSLGGKYAIRRPWAGISSSAEPSKDSSVIDKDGERKKDVAFVLISFGKDGKPDDSSYGSLLPDHDLVGKLKYSLPEFNSTDTGNKDDIYLIVTGDQIKAFLKR